MRWVTGGGSAEVERGMVWDMEVLQRKDRGRCSRSMTRWVMGVRKGLGSWERRARWGRSSAAEEEGGAAAGEW